MLVLKNEVLRSRVQEKMEVLKNITSQANILSTSIATFSSNCIPIFSTKREGV